MSEIGLSRVRFVSHACGSTHTGPQTACSARIELRPHIMSLSPRVFPYWFHMRSTFIRAFHLSVRYYIVQRNDKEVLISKFRHQGRSSGNNAANWAEHGGCNACPGDE